MIVKRFASLFRVLAHYCMPKKVFGTAKTLIWVKLLLPIHRRYLRRPS